jgi:hypothetical protein
VEEGGGGDDDVVVVVVEVVVLVVVILVVDDKENDKKERKKLEKFHLTFIVLSDNILVFKIYWQMVTYACLFVCIWSQFRCPC